MGERTNKRVLLARRPHGLPRPSDFRIEEAPIPAPKPGELLLGILYLSLDPYMRGRMNAGRSYAPPVEIGAVMEGGTVAEVLESRNEDFTRGEILLSYSGWQSYALSDGRSLRRLDPAQAPVSTALGVLGMPGFTAYAGLLNLGRPKPGETVVVAAASGAVGSAVGQIAKIKGARAVGIAGGGQKCAFVRSELGFDAAVDHRAPDFPHRLKEACPNGIDVYFENVGGALWDAILPLLNGFARIPVCGLIADYNARPPFPGPDRLPVTMMDVLTKSLTIRGFIQREFAEQRPAFYAEMGQWVREGQVRYREDVVEGLERAPEAFIGLLQGRNFGKLVVRVAAASAGTMPGAMP